MCCNTSWCSRVSTLEVLWIGISSSDVLSYLCVRSPCIHSPPYLILRVYTNMCNNKSDLPVCPCLNLVLDLFWNPFLNNFLYRNVNLGGIFRLDITTMSHKTTLFAVSWFPIICDFLFKLLTWRISHNNTTRQGSSDIHFNKNSIKGDSELLRDTPIYIQGNTNTLINLLREPSPQ